MLLAAVLFLTSCAGSSKQFLKKEFREKEINSSLLIIPVDDHFEIKPSDSDYRPFSEKDRRNFNALFGLVFQDYTTARVYGIDPQLDIDTENFSWSELNMGDDSVMRLMLPGEEAGIKYMNHTPGYLLLIQEYYISYRNHEVPKSLSLQSGHQSKYYLTLTTKYAIWHNSRNEVIGWGEAESSIDFDGILSRDIYLNLIGSVSKKIIQESPFQEKTMAY